ncbi:hypothetical protein SAMN05216526_1694 [Ectothiorhodosinus mongolicus]|uniref:Uncharacterized protein n=1 Tax=Ectothiorhodosinus mongolicus TaxID=233100 RepID=A0A1R3W4Z2_9GAMM|nr:hypothetical protein [Ectothiorhodosinus mongolicus]ULX57522.1 hypothetical protein CKX93_07495 [Ectothiorhodosinus mongolicus]SIT72620.1 hypothetical protein SAMN05216526_1694 [Ectothiorhodosinus mongolicus]
MANLPVKFGTRFFLVLLSFLGVFLSMTGILELVAGGIGSFYPPELRFPGYSMVLIISGYAMMVPIGWLYWKDAQQDED